LRIVAIGEGRLRGPIVDFGLAIGGLGVGLWIVDFGDRAGRTIYNRAKSKSKIQNHQSKSSISIANLNHQSAI
jgi:hypothetical protein